MRIITPLLASAALATTLTPASAQSFFFGNGSASATVTPGSPSVSSFNSSFGQGGFPDDGSLPGSTGGSTSFTANGVSAVGSASASYSASSGFDGLTVSASSAHSYPATLPNSSFGDFLGYGANGTGSGSAYLTVNDLVFTGPGSALPVSMNGLFQGAGSATELSSFGGNFSISLGGGAALAGFEAYQGVWGGGSLGAVGYYVIDGYTSGTMPFQTGAWIVPINTPVSLSVGLGLTVSGAGGYDTTSDSSASVSLFLPTSGPVFNLPDGFTVNSASLGIVNNTYSPVPEPEEYAACAAAGLVGFGLWRRAARRVF